MTILEKIPDMGDKDLLTLFYNASSLISEGRMMKESANVLVAIQKEWAKRLELAKQNEYKADTPDDGMLKALGYKVGKDRAPRKVRHQLLNFIITGQLPFVGSPAYVFEWGEPSTKERYRKLHRVISSLAFAGSHLTSMEIAVGDWQEDLEWLEKNWQHHFR